MSIRDRAAAWWSAWKYVAILGALLCGSLWLNLHLYVSKKVELATAPLKDRVASQEQALNDCAALQAADAARAEGLAKAADRATANLSAAGDDYRAAARQRPLALYCAPGQGRKDAVNRALGAPTQEK
jgi:hypothetical protein